MTWPFEPLQPMSCDVIVADPPWLFETRSMETGQEKGAGSKYKLMPTNEIAALPVSHLARGDCLLLLWTTGWAMATGAAHHVAKMWGFEPISEMGWRKLTSERQAAHGDRLPGSDAARADPRLHHRKPDASAVSVAVRRRRP
ncbi:MT-A70 family methyltransferase [Rhodoplanes serenus]|uniref:MT-A70 family methyltransferase n=1 Tax=Rhodoplanes serenus TaxID=200615 RepID=UPI001FE13C26|nr:MT-A70 family methyltransferase [Rhodoplanes serenus]